MKALVLAASLLMAGPSIVAAFTGSGGVDTALWHLALALLVALVAGKVLRSVLTGYERASEQAAQTARVEEAAARRAEALERRRSAA
ncbi:hypothetical protein GTR02_12505 [Kineococcus sp. R8]|uniref:hypothetical protein n=1 Tax=Kineococcus siccus TaxID=2696567 RepID=UPI0014129E2E|nr:hypothetical protein [Kineococcus siccus]NAZ82641.1 hypothetical protein [Kineococcus siccus]